MKFAKISLEYKDDRKSKMVINCFIDENLIITDEIVNGYVIEWTESQNNYCRWNFTLAFDDNPWGLVEWVEATNIKTEIEIYNIALHVGSIINRRDTINQLSEYEIINIELFN